MVDPQYKEIQKLNKIKKEYQEKAQNAEQIRQARNKLSRQYAAIQPEDLTRLEKLVPNHMDNVELIVDIDRIAKKDNVRISNISLVLNHNKKKSNTINIQKESLYKSVNLSFAFITSYENFKYFIANLRKSLRLVDIVSVDFSKEKKNQGKRPDGSDIITDDDNYKFNIVLRTYWLKK